MLRRLSLLSSILLLASSLAFTQSSDKQPSDSKDDDSVFKGPTINDINAIGHRNVGCDRGFANWYSLEKQVAMGREFARQVDQSSHLITDAKVNEYINRVGQNLVRSSDSTLPFTIKVLDDETPNAFTLPGGFMYVNSGAILTAEDEAELAGVMAHEIGHVAACHVARQQTRGTLASLAAIPVIMMGGPLVGMVVNQGLNLAVPAAFMKFSRNFEAQADYLGVQYAYKAGYDPVGMINFFERLEALEKKKKGFITKAYDSHPQTPDRVQKSQREIEAILPAKEQYIVDTSEFQEIKARLALVLNHRNLQEEKDEHPSLRRASNLPAEKPQSSDDDHPVLKRHATGGD